jgi:hypothetical protein
MNKLPVFSAQNIQDLLALHQSSESGETTYLDPSNPVHKAAVDVIQAAAGYNIDNYPHLHAMISTAKANAGVFAANEKPDNVRLVDAGKTASGKAIARVWSRSGGPSVITGGSLMVLDGDSGQILAYGNKTIVQNGFLECHTHSATALPVAGGKKLSILYQGHTTDESGNTRLFSYADTAVATDSAIQCTVTAPASATNNMIEIAVGRTIGYPPPTGTDYVYYEPTNETNNAYLIAPFVGNVALSGSVDITSLSASDISSSIYVTYTNNSPAPAEVGIASTYTTGTKIKAAFSIGSAPNILQWSFPYDQLGYASTNSIVYVNGASLNNQAYSCFYFAFNSIPLIGGGVAPAFFVCSTNTPGESSINCTVIKDLTYYYHCLAKGTLVTLEDGSTIPIEQVNERLRVKTGVDGASLAVYATVLGKHGSDPVTGSRDICRVITANGKSIVVTQSHMLFMTPDKCRMVAHLAAGDTVVTDEGMTTILSIEPIVYDDIFYGLVLGNTVEKSQKDFPVHKTNFYAGGILCADEQTMRARSRADFHDPEYMLPRIKAELRQDYSSALSGKQS